MSYNNKKRSYNEKGKFKNEQFTPNKYEKKMEFRGQMTNTEKQPGTPDYYLESFRSKERVVNLTADHETTATTRPYPAVGDRKKMFVPNSKNNSVLTDRAVPFSGALYNMINSKNSNLAVRNDALLATFTHNYLGIPIARLPLWRDADGVDHYSNELLTRFIGIQNERISLLNSYQLSNLFINSYEIDLTTSTVAYQGIASIVGTALNGLLLDYQIILRNIIDKVLMYEYLLAYENELMQIEFNFGLATLNRLYAELKRSARRGVITSVKNFIINEYVDHENYKFERLPYIIPSKASDGMDEPLIQFNLHDQGTRLAYKATPSSTAFNPTVTLSDPLDTIDFSIYSLLKAARTNDINTYVTKLDNDINALSTVVRAFPGVFADTRTAIETFSRSGLTNWRREFSINETVEQTKFTYWSHNNDTLLAIFQGHDYSFAQDGNFTDYDFINPLTRMIRIRSLWNDSDGISAFHKSESMYPRAIVFNVGQLSGEVPDGGNPIQGTPFYWSFISSGFGSFNTLTALNRLGVETNITVNQTNNNSNGPTGPARIKGQDGVYDSAFIRFPSMLANNADISERIERMRLMLKIFEYGSVTNESAIAVSITSNDYVMPVPMEMYAPDGNVDRYFRQNSTFTQFQN